MLNYQDDEKGLQIRIGLGLQVMMTHERCPFKKYIEYDKQVLE